ncbi:MAG: vanadium-dependent haloperoxidase [Chitinophagaceae bacterium]|nr:vanadium-dependent haloperoxidase [Chitinophagaceae bacterium]
MKRYLIACLFANAVAAQPPGNVTRHDKLQQQVWNLTTVMYHDVVNPPAAARFYAYSMLAGYEVLCQLDPSMYVFQYSVGMKTGLRTPISHTVDKELAVLYAILETGKNIIPSGHLLQEKQDSLLDNYRNGKVASSTIDASVELAKFVSAKIAQHSKSDGYFTLSTRQRYTPVSSSGSWRPTPPEYMAAVEPHWKTIRTFFLDSAQQFKPAPPTPFDGAAHSPFMKLVRDVYAITSELKAEEKVIANFWDCNPFAVQFQGHMSIGLKKISPGGHWMSITGIACQQTRLDFAKTVFLHTLVAMSLHDAFVSCWDEKYRSQRIRPETAINKYVDARWQPFLQTPPFPEYSSGHSVISTAVAELLTHFLGDSFAYIDSSETYIGIPARRFSSFRSAAAEARVSRLYGGIHFRDAIENGGEQGERIGKYILAKLGLQPFVKQELSRPATN